MEHRQIIIGQKPPSKYVLAVGHVVADGTQIAELVARGGQLGKAVTVALLAAKTNLIARRPKLAEIGVLAHPEGGQISTLRIVLGDSDTAALPAKPEGEPLVVGQKEASVYAVAIRTRFARGASSVLVRARQEGPICKALAAVNIAASLGFADRPGLAVIGEEAVKSGAMAPFIEITVAAPQRAVAPAPAAKKPFWRRGN